MSSDVESLQLNGKRQTATGLWWSLLRTSNFEDAVFARQRFHEYLYSRQRTCAALTPSSLPFSTARRRSTDQQLPLLAVGGHWSRTMSDGLCFMHIGHRNKEYEQRINEVPLMSFQSIRLFWAEGTSTMRHVSPHCPTAASHKRSVQERPMGDCMRCEFVRPSALPHFGRFGAGVRVLFVCDSVRCTPGKNMHDAYVLCMIHDLTNFQIRTIFTLHLVQKC